MILKTIPKRYSIFGNLENNVAPRLMKTGFREPTFRDSDFTALVGSRTPSQARDSTPDQGGKALSLRTRDFRTPSSWGGVLDSSKRGLSPVGNTRVSRFDPRARRLINPSLGRPTLTPTNLTPTLLCTLAFLEAAQRCTQPMHPLLPPLPPHRERWRRRTLNQRQGTLRRMDNQTLSIIQKPKCRVRGTDSVYWFAKIKT